MNTRNFKIIGVLAALKVMAIVIISSFYIITPAGAAHGESEFGFDFIIATAQKSFAEKLAIHEMISSKYPELGSDILNVIQNKYKDIPDEIPVIVHSVICEKDRANGIKTARAMLSMFRKRYPGAFTAIAEGIANDVLRKNPGMLDALVKKHFEIKSSSVAQFGVDAEKLKQIHEDIKKMMDEKHSGIHEVMKKAFSANVKNLKAGTVLDLIGDFSKLKAEKFPAMNETVEAIMKENPKMKKHAAFALAILKNPDFLIEAVKLVESKYSSELYDLIDGILVSLENEKDLDLFAIRQDIAKAVHEKVPDLFFKIAKIKIESKNSMHEFIAANYPTVPGAIVKVLDSALPGLPKNMFAAFEAANPGAPGKIVAGIRAKYPELENDINVLLKTKYPVLMEQIKFGK